ncbi:Ribosomal protein L7Ae/L30e/S12e/Gadd45 [Kalmanozyma brasiliensis GHG001]|uniref:H/ACA ribonucleoprotein complex subunit 2 n=1 Tax=Kalmanozyma brasiliensis (strain GHG001) TaxID=1365824 RepID=V5EPQ1_KALBG|nr:Ribosomal protein L7Ae/L30e/S12e/Gadd45 [Kalmanozyma brasiliensis GHG001]EST04923.1 Ribosomal protein L7Ae/L30e/S12e/Gadd45 [Kalmanozyma brasiliensis GHG001]
MAKDESKKDKKSKRKSDVAAMDVDAVTDVEASPSKKEKKEKKEKKAKLESAAIDDDGSDDEEATPSTLEISPIAQPLAQAKMSKKLFKLTKKASKSRGHVKRGVKEVVKALRKGEKGLVVLAGDISPIDILSHIPVLCEDTSNPYIFVESKEALGAASATKRPTSVVMIVPGGGKKAAAKGKDASKAKEEYAEDYASLHKQVQTLSDQVAMAV